MKLNFFGLKASTLCVGGSLLLLGGFVSVNLAGCGGGGGGGGGISLRKVNALFQLTLQSGAGASNATLTLSRNGSQVIDVQADENGLVTLGRRITPGVYNYVFTAEGADETSSGTVTVGTLDNQTYQIVEGDGGTGQFRITGTVFLNPSGLDDPDNNQSTANCTLNSDPVTAPLTIYVRNLDTSLGQPIIATLTRSNSDSGGYSISIPRRVLSFRVEVTEAGNEGEQYAGTSPQTAFPTTLTTVTGVNICANDTNEIPVNGTATSTVTPTSTTPVTATATTPVTPNKKK